VCPGAPPPVTEIPSSRRRVVCAGPRASPQLWRYRLPDGGAGLLSVHAFHILVMEVLPSRQLCVVRVSGGFTPGYGGAVFQMGCHLHTRTFSDRVAMTGAHALEIGL